MDKSLIFKTAN